MHYMGGKAVSGCAVAMLALCRMYCALRTLILPQPPVIRITPVYLQIHNAPCSSRGQPGAALCCGNDWVGRFGRLCR